MIDVNFVIKHIRDREYMEGVDRSEYRVRSTGEVFTPTELVIRYIDWCEKTYPDSFTNPANNFCDNSCGDGQILGEVLIRKMERGIDFETALNSIYGVEYEQTNVDVCRERLLCGQEHLRHVVGKNIQCRDALKFGYNFKPMGPARKNTEGKARLRQEKRDKLEALKKKKESHQKKLFGAILG